MCVVLKRNAPRHNVAACCDLALHCNVTIDLHALGVDRDWIWRNNPHSVAVHHDILGRCIIQEAADIDAIAHRVHAERRGGCRLPGLNNVLHIATRNDDVSDVAHDRIYNQADAPPWTRR